MHTADTYCRKRCVMCLAVRRIEVKMAKKAAFRKSFIKRIMALIFLFNVIFIILFVGMTYFTTKLNITGDTGTIVENSANAASKTLDDYFRSASIPLAILRENPRLMRFLEGSPETAGDVQEIISGMVSASDELCTLWCVSETLGTVISDRGILDNIVISDYQWYSSVAEYGRENMLVFIRDDGYNSFVGSDSQLIIVTPVIENGSFIGCVGAEITIDKLVSAVNGSVYSEGVYPMILDASGKIVSAPSGDEEFNRIFEDSEYTIGTLLAEYRTSGIINSFQSGRTTNYIMTEGSEMGWRTVIIYDGRIADDTFNRMYLQQIIILACLFMLELIATLNVVRHETKDIPEISSSIAEISAGNYDFRIHSRSDNEIGLIANSVDNLACTLEEKIAEIYDYTNIDKTTGLRNRYKMYEYISELIEKGEDHRFALLFVDIDNFKWINETLGHRLGDEFLKIFGQRLHDVTDTVFRFSGDEFIIPVEIKEDYGVVEEMIANVRSQFSEPIKILNDRLYAQFSVGISIFPNDDTNPDMLLRDADIAVSRAKEKGKGNTAYYSASLHQNVLSKATIAQKLNKALERNEFFLNFQPIISVYNGDIHGFEVLIRWESEELGYVPPPAFVQIAEETGAIEAIGTWIFETACRYLKHMNEYNKEIIMSINVSPIQLKNPGFLDKIVRTIEVFGLDPANIQVEITETSFVDIIDGGPEIIQKIADMGISIALDDFGTGYSSFSYLKDMPIKCLKVDKSFVDEISSKHKDYQITGSIIDMVRNLGIKTVVEGVESIEQYNILSEMKCDYIQGFLMSKPLSADDAIEFVMQYDELHKPSRQSLEESSNKLAAERLARQKKKADSANAQ